MKLCIVGVGLIGSSFALGIKQRTKNTDLVVMGVDQNEENAATALALEAIDRVVGLEEGLQTADATVLAIPVDHILTLLERCLDLVPEQSVLIDMGSTKEQLTARVRHHPRRGRYVAAHPIAGREKAGPAAARADLLADHVMIVCDQEQSDDDALRVALRLFETLEMKVAYTNSADHDWRLSYTSHLPHLLAFALSNTILDEARRTELIDSSGGGLKSVIRLALHSAQMWTPIFSHNRTNLTEATDKLIAHLTDLREALEKDDVEEINRLVTNANQIETLLNR